MVYFKQNLGGVFLYLILFFPQKKRILFTLTPLFLCFLFKEKSDICSFILLNHNLNSVLNTKERSFFSSSSSEPALNTCFWTRKTKENAFSHHLLFSKVHYVKKRSGKKNSYVYRNDIIKYK